MKEFYREELEKTVRRLEHIRKILEKIEPGSSEIDYSSLPVDTQTSVSKPAVKKVSRRKKPGPKAIWGNFILKRLRQLNRPVTYNDLIKDAMLFFKLGDNKKDAVRQAIMNSAFRLRNKQGKLATYRKPGTKEKYVGLKKWFDSQGKLLSEYKKRLH
ncbi:MAG: hypothetical protein GXO83_04890 [Chlorobi bacterium]|nr:hypothetical protein [Chlorobiota bacterium]